MDIVVVAVPLLAAGGPDLGLEVLAMQQGASDQKGKVSGSRMLSDNIDLPLARLKCGVPKFSTAAMGTTARSSTR